MHLLYPHFHAQSFYRNTYLVDRPQQIARAEKADREWNSIDESGCHFTCLAMIAGVDPAALASAMIGRDYYSGDEELPAKALDGRRGPLVWDQNEPAKKGRRTVFAKLWLPARGELADVEFICRRWKDGLSLASATRLAHEAIVQGRHVVCGSIDHSILIAGLSADGPLVWDPEIVPKADKASGVTAATLPAMVAGGLSLRAWGKLRRVSQFTIVEYEVQHRPRAPRR